MRGSHGQTPNRLPRPPPVDREQQYAPILSKWRLE